MNFKINFLMFFVTTTNFLQVFCSAPIANPTQLSIGNKYLIPDLPAQDAAYVFSGEEPCMTNLWGRWPSKERDLHQEVEQIIRAGQVKDACALAPRESFGSKVSTKAPDFVDELTLVTNEKIQALRATQQKQQQAIFKNLQEQRKEHLKLVTAISWKIRAHNLLSITKTSLDRNKDLFLAAINECLAKEQESFSVVVAEYAARIEALTDIKKLLES
jgi:hypothetical protein